MRSSPARRVDLDAMYSIGEIARAAGVPVREVAARLAVSRPDAHPQYVGREEAVRLVRALSAAAGDRPPLSILPRHATHRSLPLLLSMALHVALFAIFALASSALFGQHSTEQVLAPLPHERLVFLVEPGPGGGGGGGLKTPELPPAPQPAPKVRHVSPPVRLARRTPPRRPIPDPPRLPSPPAELPKITQPVPEPPRPDPPRVPPAPVQAPVASRTAETVASTGASEVAPRPESGGPGGNAGADSGSGTGVGGGRGAGVGPGANAGTGGGPYQPGADIQPPTLVREVKPRYTDEARKRSVQGSVILAVVVRHDGTVGEMQVLRSLGAGLDDRAREAVREWRFKPAVRRGVPVDVQVEVAVQFKLR